MVGLSCPEQAVTQTQWRSEETVAQVCLAQWRTEQMLVMVALPCTAYVQQRPEGPSTAGREAAGGPSTGGGAGEGVGIAWGTAWGNETGLKVEGAGSVGCVWSVGSEWRGWVA